MTRGWTDAGRTAGLLHNQTEMLAGISHDLRSAVTRLQLRTELLEESADKSALLRTVEDMRLMVQALSDTARGLHSREPLRRTDLCALVASLCDDLIEAGCDLRYHCPESAIVVPCRPGDLRRAAHNVIDNALTYGGAAQLALERDGGTARIIVEDSGPGIPEDAFDAVLRPFFRLGTSRPGGGAGTGLGLSITLNILHALGGDLRLSNHPRGGLRVELVLPIEG